MVWVGDIISFHIIRRGSHLLCVGRGGGVPAALVDVVLAASAPDFGRVVHELIGHVQL